MFRQVGTIALAALTAVGSLTLATAAETKQAGGAKQITNSIGMKLTLIPAGEFKMGSSESEKETAAFFNKSYGKDLLQADFFKDEHPQHRVRITKSFYLGMYHVTRGQFRQFVKDTGYKTDAEKGDEPGARGVRGTEYSVRSTVYEVRAARSTFAPYSVRRTSYCPSSAANLKSEI